MLLWAQIRIDRRPGKKHVQSFQGQSPDMKCMTPGGVGGGGEYSTKYYTRRLRPEVQPLTLLYTIIHQKITPFVYPLLNLNGTLFTYPYNSLEFCAPINVTSLKYEWITTTECFLDFFTAIKCICLIALLGLFSTGMTDFPTCTTTSKISTLSYTWRLKLYPFPAVLDTKGSTPTPPPPPHGKMHDTLMRLFSLQLDTFKSVFHLRLSRGCKLVWFETEIGSWTNSIHIDLWINFDAKKGFNGSS